VLTNKWWDSAAAAKALLLRGVASTKEKKTRFFRSSD